jgi:hypothetical protein
MVPLNGFNRPTMIQGICNIGWKNIFQSIKSPFEFLLCLLQILLQGPGCQAKNHFPSSMVYRYSQKEASQQDFVSNMKSSRIVGILLGKGFNREILKALCLNGRIRSKLHSYPHL